MDKIEKLVLELYESREPVKRIARMLTISEAKVCKILCSNGIAPTTRAAEVMRLREAGKTQNEIAEILGVSADAVNRYMPYTRGMKYSDNPTVNAIRIREYRKRMQQPTKPSSSR